MKRNKYNFNRGIPTQIQLPYQKTLAVFGRIFYIYYSTPYNNLLPGQKNDHSGFRFSILLINSQSPKVWSCVDGTREQVSKSVQLQLTQTDTFQYDIVLQLKVTTFNITKSYRYFCEEILNPRLNDDNGGQLDCKAHHAKPDGNT